MSEKKVFIATQTMRFLVFIGILLLCWTIGRSFEVDTEYYRNVLNHYPKYLSGFIFIVMYVVVTFFVLFGAKDVFRITAALIFGGIISTIYVSIAELCNAAVLFFLSRRLGRDFVEKKFGWKSKDNNADWGDIGFWGVFTLRINPLVAFRGMDIGFGLTQINFKKYFWACAFATIPRVFWLQSIIDGIGKNLFKDIGLFVEYLSDHPSVIIYSMGYFLIVFIMTIFVFGGKWLKIRKRNRERKDENN